MTARKEKLDIIIDMTNLMHVGFHAPWAKNLTTDNMWYFEGEFYTKNNGNKIFDAVRESYSLDLLLDMFKDDATAKFLENKGFKLSDLDPSMYSDQGDFNKKVDDLAKYIITIRFSRGDFNMPTGSLANMVKKIDSIVDAYGDKDIRLIGCWDNINSRKAVESINTDYLNHIKENKPDIYAEMTSSKKGTEYKADREKSKSELLVQFKMGKLLFEAMGGLNVDVDGFEADHCIGVLAHNAKDTLIVTRDKDMSQLINDERNVFMLPTTAIPKTMTVVEAEQRGQYVNDKFNIEPAYVADFLAIQGDGIDNIRGLTGFGAKKAATLINKFGSLEDIISGMSSLLSEYGSIEKMHKNAKELGLGGVSKKNMSDFFDNIEEVKFCKRMTVLDDSWPVDLTFVDDYKYVPDEDRMMKAFDVLKFNVSKRKLEGKIRKRKPISR